MRAYVELEDGARVEVGEIESVTNGNLIIIHAECQLRNGTIEKIEKYLAGKFGKKVIILDKIFGKVY